MTTYSTGTVSIGSGSTTLTGSGTAWATSGVRPGDWLHLAGLSVRIATVDSATQITLARAWPGSTQSAVAYDIQMVDDGVRTLTSANALLQALGSGTLTSLAGLTSAANLMPYWTGSGVMGTTALTSAARSLLDDTSVSAMRATLELVPTSGTSDTTAGRLLTTGAGPVQAFRRGNILGTVGQASGVPTGAIIERGSNANGEFVRFADGTQICAHIVAGLEITTAANSLWRSNSTNWTFPAVFAAPPVVAASLGILDTRWVTCRAVSTTTGQARQYRTETTTSLADYQFLAVGRWF